MKLGYIGLGRMGSNMVERLIEMKHEVVVYDVNQEAVQTLEKAGAQAASSVENLISKLDAPKTVWVMVPRAHVQSVLDELVPLLSKGDTIIEGGNTYYQDSKARAAQIEKEGINYLDVGVSGGVEGARHGACMMIGGKRQVFEKFEPLFKDLTVLDGYGYMGRSGAGHFVKMVHNAVEYGMMASIAEGVNTIDHFKGEFDTDLSEVIKVYGHGSIIESRLISWLDKAWSEDAELSQLPGEVPYGETEEEMEKLEEMVRTPILTISREERVATRSNPSFTGKIINALRFQFGGHNPNKK